MEDASQSKAVWEYLVSHVKSDYLEFAADGYWSAGWSEERRVETRQEIIRQLKEGNHIDFMIAMGTWAGQDLANNEHHTPTMAVSVSDPVRAGISATMNDSGLDHFRAKCDPTRYIRQLRLFHRFVKFKRIGVVYENSREGKTYAALEDIQTVAAERGFKVVTCEAPFAQVDPDTAFDGVVRCHEQLATQVDAVYVTVHRGIVLKRMADIVAPLLAHKIPTWSQRGPEEVKRGVLFSISRAGFKAVGRYHAEVMARVFNGERPRSISQIFEDPKLIAVNLKVAELIDFHVPNSVLRIADLIYERIEE